MTQYWRGGTKHFFLLVLYDFNNIGGGGARAPQSLTEQSTLTHERN